MKRTWVLARACVRWWNGRWAMPIALGVLGAAWLWYVIATLDLTPIKNSEGYLMRSEHSLLSREFYFGPRPFVTSLMYKLYGSTERGAVLGQLAFSTVSWLVLTLSLGRFIESPLRRLLHCLLFPTLAAWWNVMGWNMVMRAESTAFSWLALFVLRWPHTAKVRVPGVRDCSPSPRSSRASRETACLCSYSPSSDWCSGSNGTGHAAPLTQRGFPSWPPRSHSPRPSKS